MERTLARVHGQDLVARSEKVPPEDRLGSLKSIQQHL